MLMRGSVPSAAVLLAASPQFRANQQPSGRIAGASVAVGGLCSRSCLRAWLCPVG